MKRIFRYILLALMVAAVAAPAYGASKKGSKAKSGKGKAKTEAAAPAPKKSKYDKFVSAKGTVRYPGIVDLYQDKSGKKNLKKALSFSGDRLIKVFPVFSCFSVVINALHVCTLCLICKEDSILTLCVL